jgi:hypothetical protein
VCSGLKPTTHKSRDPFTPTLIVVISNPIFLPASAPTRRVVISDVDVDINTNFSRFSGTTPTHHLRRVEVPMILFTLFTLATSDVPGMINSGTPPSVPASYDCAVRVHAYEFGKTTLPQRGVRPLHSSSQ